MAVGTKRCPYCAEQIQAQAVICRFCNVDLATGKRASAAKSGGAKRVVVGCLSVGGGIFAILMVVLIYIGARSPETFVVNGSKVRSHQLEEMRKLGMLEPGESVEYFYSDGLFKLEEGAYVVTQSRLVLYDDDWPAPLQAVEFSDIAEVDAFYSDSWFEDSMILVTTADGTELTFPLSSEKGGDRRFVEFLESRSIRLQEE